MSSMCPTIVVQNNATGQQRAVKMVVGAAGGSRITTSTALVSKLVFDPKIYKQFGLPEPIKQAVLLY